MISQRMDNSIFALQNDDILLRCQLAQRNEYAHAKNIEIKRVLRIVGFTVLSIISSVMNVDWLTALSSLLAVVLAVSNKYTDVHIQSHKKHAAAIQQYVDVTLYSKVLGCGILEWGEVVTRSQIVETVADYKNCDVSDVLNWYSDYSSLASAEQVFFCQRENIRWDYNLHKQFFRFLIGFYTFAMVIVLFGAIITDISFVKFLCVASWMIPVLEYGYSDYKKFKESGFLVEETNRIVEEIEKKLLSTSTDNVKNDLIQLQYKIRQRRELGYLIPDWFYKRHEKRYHKREDSIAHDMANFGK